MDLGPPWTTTALWVKMTPVLSPSTLPLCLELLVPTCSSMSLYLFYLAGDLQGVPGCALCPLGISRSTAQGLFRTPGLVAGICNLLGDVGESLHGLFSFCFSVFNLQVKL